MRTGLPFPGLLARSSGLNLPHQAIHERGQAAGAMVADEQGNPEAVIVTRNQDGR